MVTMNHLGKVGRNFINTLCIQDYFTVKMYYSVTLFLIEVQLIYNVLVSGVQQSDSVEYIYRYPLFFRFFSHLGHYRVLSRVPCAIQWVLTYTLLYIKQITNDLLFLCTDLFKTSIALRIMSKLPNMAQRARPRMMPSLSLQPSFFPSPVLTFQCKPQSDRITLGPLNSMCSLLPWYNRFVCATSSPTAFFHLLFVNILLC